VAGVRHQCGAEVPTGALLCPGCGFPVFRTPPPDPPPSRTPDPDPDPDPEPRLATRTCVTPWCRREYPASAERCPECGQPAGPAVDPPAERDGARRVRLARLRLRPGLEIGVRPGETLVVGRASPDDRIATFLDRFDGVSRRHLELRVGDRQVVVTDLDSTNGTYLDEAPVDRSTPVPAGEHGLRLGHYAEVQLDVVGEDTP
jgi:pSer/pThr/pTyr-binding forkhead associated (FHA) protein